MRIVIKDNEVELGFQLIRKQSRRKPAVAISALSYADDIAIISEETEQSLELLSRVEMNASEIGLQLNSKKTKIMAFAQTNPVNTCTTLSAQIIIVDNFKYLGSWMNISLKDFEFHKALTWKACQKMKKLYKSNLAITPKIRIIKVTIETISLYESETWTINKLMDAIPNIFA